MNVPLLHYLINLIEEVLKVEVPVVEKVAVETAVSTAESDPKAQAVVAASIAVLSATQGLKAALGPPPPPPPPAA